MNPFKPRLTFLAYEHLNIPKVKLLRFAAAGDIQQKIGEDILLYILKSSANIGIRKTHLIKEIFM